jgi:nicotinic acid mononucleotide adenylyltransferase
MLDPWEALQPHYTPTLDVLRHIQAELQAWLAAGNRPQPTLPTTTPRMEQAAPSAASTLAKHVSKPLAGAGQAVQGAAVATEQPFEPPRVMLLCGADVLLSFTVPGVWQNPDVLLQEHGVVCVVREGVDLEQLMQHELLRRWVGTSELLRPAPALCGTTHERCAPSPAFYQLLFMNLFVPEAVTPINSHVCIVFLT